MARSGQKGGQIGLVEAATELGRGVAQLLEGEGEVAPETVKVFGLAVGQVRLADPPHALVGVEFGSVGGQWNDMQARVARAQSAHRFAAVGGDVVPEQEEGAAQMTQQVADEAADVAAPDIVVVELVVEPQAVTPGTDGDRRDGRDPVVPVAVAQAGRLPTRRPGPAHGGNQEEARFVGEDEVGAQPPGVFFTWGHTSRFQRSMARSLRSRARRSGFWGLQPRACRRRPT